MSDPPDVLIRRSEAADAQRVAAMWFGDGSENEEGQPDLRYAWRPD